MHARYYSPVVGRFLSVDPTWSTADLGRPQSWNRYSYVENRPTTLTDPDGKCPICVGVAIAFAYAVLSAPDTLNAPAPGDRVVRNGPDNFIKAAMTGAAGGTAIARSMLPLKMSRGEAEKRSVDAHEKANAEHNAGPRSQRPATTVGATNRTTGETTTDSPHRGRMVVVPKLTQRGS